MKTFRADLHIHTVLSPCGSLEMSPGRIVDEALLKGIDIIGITDHNTTRHCRLVSDLAARKGIFVLKGAEVTTREEVHCLVFFENTEKLLLLQNYIDSNLPDVWNDPVLFGDQVEVDEDENIIYTEHRMLLNATSVTIDDLGKFVHDNGGLFIPAHIDRMKNSIFSQLGFLPEGLNADALEVSAGPNAGKFLSAHPGLSVFSLITSSDAHFPERIGTTCTFLELEEASFTEIRLALKGENGRRILR